MPIEPGELARLIFAITICLCMLIPVVGLTARFALKPMVDAFLRMRDSQSSGQAVQLLERRTALLEQEVQSLQGVREELARLSEEQEFHLQLGGRRTEPKQLS